MEYYSWKDVKREMRKQKIKDEIHDGWTWVCDHKKEIIIVTVALAPVVTAVIRTNGARYNNSMLDRRTWDPSNGVYFHHAKMSNSQKVNYAHFRDEGMSVLDALRAAGVKIN